MREVKFPTIIILGITNQDGRIMSELLIEKGRNVIGLIHSSIAEKNELSERVILEKYDVLESDRICEIIKKYKPDEFYNFIIYPSSENIDIKNILEAIRLYSPHTKFYQNETPETFGNSEKTLTNLEDKQYAHFITKLYREKYGIFAVEGVLFDHESEYGSSDSIMIKIINAAKNNKELEVENIFSEIDCGYTREYMKYIWQMLQKESPSVYIISTGEIFSIKELIEKSYKKNGIDISWNKDFTVGIDQSTKREMIRVKNPKNRISINSSQLYKQRDKEFVPNVHIETLIDIIWKAEDYSKPIYIAFGMGLCDFLSWYGINFVFPYQKFIFVITGEYLKGGEIGASFSVLNFAFKNVISIEDFLKEGHSISELARYDDSLEKFPNMPMNIRKWIGYEKEGRLFLGHMSINYWGRKYLENWNFFKEKLLNPIKAYPEECSNIIKKIDGMNYNLFNLRLVYGGRITEQESISILNIPEYQKWIDNHKNIIILTETKIGYSLIEKTFNFKNNSTISLKSFNNTDTHAMLLIATYCNDIITTKIGGFGTLLSYMCRGKCTEIPEPKYERLFRLRSKGRIIIRDE